jgi:hypothetical protein
MRFRFSVLQEVGMKGHIGFLDDPPPTQTGVMFCGDGSEDSKTIFQALMDAKVVGVGTPGPVSLGHDKDGKEITLPYCPPGSLFVGLRPPLSTIRAQRLELKQVK